MRTLNVIPYPKKVVNLGGKINLKNLDPLGLNVERDSSLGEEDYTLSIMPKEIKVAAGGDRGEFYARQTLSQLANSGECPCVRIEDSPAFPYRAFMLDCARHMTSVENIKKLIDAAALVKMNAMHWHLTDDQGWRVQIDSHPELVEIGSKRASSDFGQYHFNEEYSGFFTKAEIREVVEYAAERFIEVVPEFDLPGHTLSVLAAHPELSCRGTELKVGTKQGIFDDILCAGNDDALQLVFDVLGEMAELFPGRNFHIGGDEAPKKRWAQCPKCQARMKELGLQNEEELQGWFVNRAIDFLRQRGKTAVVWNESLNSGMMPKDCVAQRWMDKKNRTAEFANNGGKVIVSDFYFYYCDYPYGMTPLKKTYNYSPYFKGLSEEGKNNIIGVETPIWTEYIRDFDKLCYMCFPRFSAVAETGWSLTENRNLKSFMHRFENLAQMLTDIGINPAPAKNWNPNPIKRLIELKQFFKGTFNWETVKNSFSSTNA